MRGPAVSMIFKGFMSSVASAALVGGTLVSATSIPTQAAEQLHELPTRRMSTAVTGASPSSTASLIQTIETSVFDPPSPDPAGLAYNWRSDTLFVSDSEVNETTLFTGDNIFEIDVSGIVLATNTTIPFSDEPTGLAFDQGGRTLFVTDDRGARVVYVVNLGRDGTLGTADDTVTSFSTSTFGSTDPEGIAFVPGRRSRPASLFIVDGVGAEVYRIRPGRNGKFDGVDDRVTSFDTVALGVTDPEGLAYNPENGHLYLAGRPSTSIFEVTLRGSLVQTIDISAADGRNLAGLEFAPSSTSPDTLSLYIADRRIDNNVDPDQNDGRIYEVTVPPPD